MEKYGYYCCRCGVFIFSTLDKPGLPKHDWLCWKCIKIENKSIVANCINCGNSHSTGTDYCKHCTDRGLTNPKVESFCNCIECKKQRFSELNTKNKPYSCSVGICVRRVDKVVEDLCTKTFPSKVDALLWLLNNGFTRVEDSVFLYGNGANVFATKVRD